MVGVMMLRCVIFFFFLANFKIHYSLSNRLIVLSNDRDDFLHLRLYIFRAGKILSNISVRGNEKCIESAGKKCIMWGVYDVAIFWNFDDCV